MERTAAGLGLRVVTLPISDDAQVDARQESQQGSWSGSVEVAVEPLGGARGAADNALRQGVMAIPPNGWIETVEIRFPVQPGLCLIASWHPGEEADRCLAGSCDQAVNLNLALVAQAERQWFHVPDRYPALPSAIERHIELDLQPISPDLIPGYGPTAARESPLRESITAEIADLIERQDDTVIKIGRPTFDTDRRV